MSNDTREAIESREDLAALLVDTVRELRRAKLEATVWRELAASAIGRCWTLQHTVEGLRRALNGITPHKRRAA